MFTKYFTVVAIKSRNLVFLSKARFLSSSKVTCRDWKSKFSAEGIKTVNCL